MYSRSIRGSMCIVRVEALKYSRFIRDTVFVCVWGGGGGGVSHVFQIYKG